MTQIVQVFVAVFIIDQDRLLLVKHVSPHEIFYTLAGGKVESGELCSQAAIRETYEEVGIRIQEQDLVFAHIVSRQIDAHTSSVVIFFNATKWQGNPYNKEPQKHQEVAWFTLNALPSTLRFHHRQAFELWQKKVCYSEFPYDIKHKNQEFYDKNAERFEHFPFADVLPHLIEKYLRQAPGSQVLDVGAGAGVVAQWVSQKGFSVLCLDPSSEMIKRCKDKGLDTWQGTLQEFTTEKHFDIVFAISSLIHLTREEFPQQIRKIASLLNPTGLFFLSIIKGTSEGWEDPTNVGLQRFFSSFTHDEAAAFLSPTFEILEVHEKEVLKMNKTFLIYVLKKR